MDQYARKLDQLMAELDKLQSDVSGLKDMLAPQHIRNLAAYSARGSGPTAAGGRPQVP